MSLFSVPEEVQTALDALPTIVDRLERICTAAERLVELAAAEQTARLNGYGAAAGGAGCGRGSRGGSSTSSGAPGGAGGGGGR